MTARVIPLVAILATAVIAATAATARAEGVASYDVAGDADAGAGDSRVAALDDAFARAAGMAITDLVAADARAQHKADLDREVMGHARLWVASFKVGKDDTVEGRRQLVVTVKIDRDKLRARLLELGITAAALTPVDPTAPASRTVTVLLRVDDPAGAHADYGMTADKDTPGVAALSAVLRRAGMTIKRAPASGPAARAEGELPLDDSAAEALAGDAHAELAAIAGIAVGAPAPVRGLPTLAVRIDAHVRVIERVGHAVVGQGTAVSAARSPDGPAITAAIDRAVALAAADLVPAGSRRLAAGGTAPSRADDIPLTTPGVVLLRLPAKTPWSLIETESHYLGGARGIRSVVVRRLSPAGWVLAAATDDSVGQIASLARKSPATGIQATAKVTGEVVELALSAPPPSAPGTAP